MLTRSLGAVLRAVDDLREHLPTVRRALGDRRDNAEALDRVANAVRELDQLIGGRTVTRIPIIGYVGDRDEVTLFAQPGADGRSPRP